MNTIEFNEVQRFKTWWAWTAVTGLNLLIIYAIVQQVILGKPFGSKPASDLILLLIELGPLALIIFLISIKLKTRIDDNGIHYRFFPFQLKTTHIEWNELRDAYVREYNSFYEYGGWGIRTGSDKSGKAINTSASGPKGLQLKFKDNKLLLIGTKKPDEIQALVEKVISSGKINREI